MVERPPPQPSLRSLNPLQQSSAVLCVNTARSQWEVRHRLALTCPLALKCHTKTLETLVSHSSFNMDVEYACHCESKSKAFLEKKKKKVCHTILQSEHR